MPPTRRGRPPGPPKPPREPKKRGRPRKSDEERRSEQVTVHVRPATKAALVEMANGGSVTGLAATIIERATKRRKK